MVNPQGCPYVPPDPLLVHQAAQAWSWFRQVFAGGGPGGGLRPAHKGPPSSRLTREKAEDRLACLRHKSGSGCGQCWQAECLAVVIAREPSLKVGVLCCPVFCTNPQLCQDKCAHQNLLPCVQCTRCLSLLCALCCKLFAFELLGLLKLFLQGGDLCINFGGHRPRC